MVSLAAAEGVVQQLPEAASAEAEQRYLRAALKEVRLALEHAGAASDEEAARLEAAILTARHEAAAIEASLSGPSRFHRLAGTFHLSGFERGVMLLCAGVEMDPRFAGLCASARSAQAHTQTERQAWRRLRLRWVSSRTPIGRRSRPLRRCVTGG